MSRFDVNDHNRIRRVPKRAHYDRATVYTILDDAPICHVGMVEGDRPVVIPTLHARDGDTLLLHGATTSRLMQHVAAGHNICVTVTHVDGLVLARSVFHHSVNYRSVVVFGNGTLVETDEAKMDALARFTNKLIPDRWEDARQPNANELKATAVVAIPLNDASAKVRVGGPVDDDEDYALPYWAGVVPIHTAYGAPIADERLPAEIPLPGYVETLIAD